VDEVNATPNVAPGEGKYYKRGNLRQEKFRENEINNSRAIRARRARSSHFREVFGVRHARDARRNRLIFRSIRASSGLAAAAQFGRANAARRKNTHDTLCRVIFRPMPRSIPFSPGFVAVGSVLFFLSTLANAQANSPSLPVIPLVPGFAVRELPVQLTNINNLHYEPDGKLWALGYDGRIHILSDADGDGVEETVKTWWTPKNATAFRGPIGMIVSPEGVYVASKGKISLIKDTDKDGTADAEEIVTTGWKEIIQAVDATGLAMDKEGNLYFCLGTTNFAEAYLLDKQGKSHYDLKSERGTIVKLSADRKRREVLATGVRFAIGIAFNRHGDLFWTDQEGDTWTHGNHLDELNVLMIDPRGGPRHYGFPERHPVHLPNTIDEPPVLGFGPQHQSTCGLKFNEPREGFKTFGPKLWENDALVVGESRGKIWRVPLVKVRDGYVGRQQLIACTQMLTIDCETSPAGDLAICCHSGPPDWGTGPTGKGRLFKLVYVDREAPQPVIAWPAAQDEIRVAFDRPIDKSVESRLPGLSVSAGQFVRAGDRYELMSPPYAVVRAQKQTPTYSLKIESAKLSEDGRTLAIKVEPMQWRTWYALAIPGVKRPGEEGLGFTVDVDFPLAGVQAQFLGASRNDVRWEGWLPHIDTSVNRELTRGSAEHEALFKLIDQMPEGALVLRGIWHPEGEYAGPYSQPGTILTIINGGGIEMRERGGRVKVVTGPSGLTARVETFTGPHKDQFESSPDDPPARAVPLLTLIPQWAPTERPPFNPNPPESDLVKGGDWQAGRALFFGEAKCSTCHAVRGQGGNFAPDLSNYLNINPESVLQDIVTPSARINPDFPSFIIDLKSGDTISGLMRPGPEAAKMIVVEGVDKVATIERSQVKDMRPAKLSVMPEGYKEQLGDKKIKDLLTFLTTEEPKPRGKQ
jgi:putative heme-binding domain-containing protein